MENNYQAPMQEQPAYQPPMPPVQPEPKKKKNVGLTIAIIAVSIAIVAVSALGLMLFGGFGAGKKVETIMAAINSGDMTTAIETFDVLKDNAKEENAPQFAAALAQVVKSNPYDDTGLNGFNEDDIARFMEYGTFASQINMSAYEPAAATYIQAVCALEPYVAYNPIIAATLEISDYVMSGLNNCTTGFNYMSSNYMFLGGGYLDDAVADFDKALAVLGDYDMSGLQMQEYYDSIQGMRDCTARMADAGRSGDLTALIAETEEYSTHIENFQNVTNTMSGVVGEISELMANVDSAYAAL